jgi:hypothetical protein
MTLIDVGQKRLRLRRLLFAFLAIGLVSFVAYADNMAGKDEQAKKLYLEEHPLTEKQIAANNHFGACWQYRHASPYVLSEKRRNMMLRAEKCYLDERDDPRYDDATYPWNRDAPQPWRQAAPRAPLLEFGARKIGSERSNANRS